MSAFVYTIWGFGRTPLYIGCTTNLPRRLNQHRTQRHWWPEVKRIDLAWYADVEEAFSVELTQIDLLRPWHNVAGNPRYPCAELIDGPPTARDRKLQSLYELHREREYARIFRREDVEALIEATAMIAAALPSTALEPSR